MPWEPLSIVFPDVPHDEVLDALPESFSVITADPWQYGIGEGGGHYRYLSFPNAVEAIINRLPADYDGALLGIGVAASNLEDLADRLDALDAAFPYPSFGKAARRARKLSTLEADKFNLPAPLASGLGSILAGGLPRLGGIKAAALRQAAAALCAVLPDPLAALTDLAGAKAAHDSEVAGALAEAGTGMEGEPDGAFRCYAEADYAAELRAGAPGYPNTLSVVVVLLGSAEDLQLMRVIFDAVA